MRRVNPSVWLEIRVIAAGVGKAHNGRQVGFDRVGDPCRERLCFATTKDAVEPHGEAAHRREGGRAGLESVDFLRLIRGELSAGFDAQGGRDDGWRLGSVLGTLLQLPKNRVIADPKAQTVQGPLGRPPAGRMPKRTDNLPDTCGATCKRTRNRGDLFRERPPCLRGRG